VGFWAFEAQEETMRVMKFISLAVILVAVLILAAAQDASVKQTTDTQTTEVKHVPITNTRADSGKEMFKSYCAVCHGTDGKGNGPAASALKTPPPDLTLLAQKNGGKYPAPHVVAVIRGRATVGSHGTQEMPIWGPLFSSISQGNEAQVQQRVTNLDAYIATLQAK
jgi:mono/diheme cytochrome c family protein